MRTRLSVRVPAEASAQHLLAIASLLAAIGAENWPGLAQSFSRMDGAKAVLAPPMRGILEDLSDGLRAEARARAELQAAP